MRSMSFEPGQTNTYKWFDNKNIFKINKKLYTGQQILKMKPGLN